MFDDVGRKWRKRLGRVPRLLGEVYRVVFLTGGSGLMAELCGE